MLELENDTRFISGDTDITFVGDRQITNIRLEEEEYEELGEEEYEEIEGTQLSNNEGDEFEDENRHWITLDSGARVFVEYGKITKGPKALVDKSLDELSDKPKRYPKIAKVSITRKSFTGEEVGAIDRYSTGYYDKLNSGLRKGRVSSASEEEVAGYIEESKQEKFGEGKQYPDTVAMDNDRYDEYLIYELDGALKKNTLKKPTKLYRGVTLSKKLKVGDALVDKAYTSTTSSYEVAEKYARKTKSKGTKYVFEINVPAGTHAIDMASSGAFQQNLVGGEREILLPRNTGIKIVSVTKDKGGLSVVKAKMVKTKGK